MVSSTGMTLTRSSVIVATSTHSMLLALRSVKYACISTLVVALAMVMKKLVGVKPWTRLLQKLLAQSLQLFDHRFAIFFFFWVASYFRERGYIFLIYFRTSPSVLLRYSCNHLCLIRFLKTRGWGIVILYLLLSQYSVSWIIIVHTHLCFTHLPFSKNYYFYWKWLESTCLSC